MSTTTKADDEYAIYDDFSQLTEEDLAIIDSAIASSSKGLPDLEVQLEDTPSDSIQSSSASSPKKSPSPLWQFRRKKLLSVTDLVSPAWCEVQFDYGLRQKRHRKLENRPESFVTEKGKEIIVDKKVAAKSDKITKAGQSVHKELEQEIRPQEISIAVSTEEERWALRLIDMLECLESLMTLGCAREIPVFGFVSGHIILGKIDEILRKEAILASPTIEKKRGLQSSPNTPQKPKRSRRSPSPSQPQITAFLTPIKDPEVGQAEDQAPSSVGISLPPRSNSPTFTFRHMLYVIDTKTRRVNSLPQDGDTVPARLQLMLYHRMLTNLLSTSTPFDFGKLWRQLKLNPALPFSSDFIYQTQLQLDTSISTTVTCLDGLTMWWHQTICSLNIGEISPTLEIIYRLQPRKKARKRKKRKSARSPDSVSRSREESDLAKATEASLRDLSSLLNEEEQLAKALAQSMADLEAPDMKDVMKAVQLKEGADASSEDPELLWAYQQSLLTHLNELETTDKQAPISTTPVESEPQTEESDSEVDQGTKIIGTKEFTFDDKFLNDYLTDVMQWWHGIRKSRGVPVEQSGRCFSCEYRAGCEWREEKAREIEDEVRRRRANLEPNS